MPVKILPRLFIAALAWGVLAFGAVYPWAFWPLAAASAGLGLWSIVRTDAWRDPRIRQLGIGLLILGAAIGLQAVIVPYAWVDWLSPGVDRFLRTYEFAYRPTPWHALSIDAGSTLVVLMLYASFALLLLGLLREIRQVKLEWLLTQVMGLGVGLALVGVVQRALLDREHPLVYGFWQPQEGGNPFGPFINRNHFAGWMVMALPVVIGYSCAVMARSGGPHRGGWRAWLRWGTTVEASRFLLVAFSIIAMGMSLVLTGSRSGIVSFAVAIGVLAYFALRRVSARRTRLAAAGYMAVLLLGALAWAGADTVVARFSLASSEAEGRLAAWRDTVRMVEDFPVFGTGMGTYRRAMLVYQTADRGSMYAQAHNDYLQLASEGGAIVVVPALAVLGLFVFGVRRRFISGDDDPLTGWVRIGAVAGLAGIAAQSFVEFSLQMPGNDILFVLLAALAFHRPVRLSSHAHRV
jgi:O-antigen ligase